MPISHQGQRRIVVCFLISAGIILTTGCGNNQSAGSKRVASATARVCSTLRRINRVAGRADCRANVIGAASTISNGPSMPRTTCWTMCNVNVVSGTTVDTPIPTHPAQNDTVRVVGHWRPFSINRRVPRT